MRAAGNLIGIFLLFSLTGYAVSPPENPATGFVGDSLFVRNSIWPDTEKDELVILLNGDSYTVYTLFTVDGSFLRHLVTFGEDAGAYSCFEAYNAAADGSSYLFYKGLENRLLITYGTYSEYEILPGSVDFDNNKVLLTKREGNDFSAGVLDLGKRSDYYIGNSETIRVELKEIWPCYDGITSGKSIE